MVITGGAGFLGAGFADAVLGAGARCALLDVDGTALERVGRWLAERHPPDYVLPLEIDITDESAVQRGLHVVLTELGAVDALVNNAARNPVVAAGKEPDLDDRLERMSVERWRGELEVGLTGAFICSRVFGHEMAASSGGAIVNISSDLALISPDQRLYRLAGRPDDEQPVKPVSYSVVKAGLGGLTRYLATYWADRNVRANELVFGGVRRDQDAEFLRRIGERIPLGRLAEQEEYSPWVVLLCSPAASYLNGASIVVDGGRTIW